MGNPAALASMPNWVIGMPNKQGFTLIEILVVLFIIGITMGFALLAFGDFGEKRRIALSGEQFKNYVALVEQRAILEGSTLGIGIDKRSYQAFRLQMKTHWQPISHHGIFQSQYFPNGSIIRYDSMGKKTSFPQIIIQSSGDLSPFTLTLSSQKETAIATIIGASNGELSVQ